MGFAPQPLRGKNGAGRNSLPQQAVLGLIQDPALESTVDLLELRDHLFRLG